MRKRITKDVSVEVDIDPDEFSNDDLIKEIEFRGGYKVVKENHPEQYPVPTFETTDKLLKFLNKIMGLKPYHNKDRLIKEIQEL